MAGKKESAIDLARMLDKGVRVKLAGGREGESVLAHTAVIAAPGVGGLRGSAWLLRFLGTLLTLHPVTRAQPQLPNSVGHPQRL